MTTYVAYRVLYLDGHIDGVTVDGLMNIFLVWFKINCFRRIYSHFHPPISVVLLRITKINLSIIWCYVFFQYQQCFTDYRNYLSILHFQICRESGLSIMRILVYLSFYQVSCIVIENDSFPATLKPTFNLAICTGDHTRQSSLIRRL